LNAQFADAADDAEGLIELLEGKGRSSTSRRAVLKPGVQAFDDVEVALRMDADNAWSVEINQGRLGIFGRGSSTQIFGDPEILEAIIKGTESGIEAFLDGRVRVRGNIALSLQIEGMFAARARPKRFPRPAFVNAGGIDTFFLEAGSGPPVVLLHGLGATNASMLPTLWDLARDHHVFAPDLPGFGGSDKPIRTYDFPFFARWLADFLDALGLKRADLVGNSLGGRISLEAGLRLPDRVDRLVLYCPSPAFLRGRQYVPFVRWLRPEMALVPMLLTHGTVAGIARSMFADPKRLRPEWYDSFADEFLRVFATPRGRIAFFSAARQVYLEPPDGEDGFWDRLGELKAPTLFIWGENDWLVPARFERHVVEALPAAKSVVLPDCGHVPQYELPERTAELTREFLDNGRRKAANGAGGGKPLPAK
jgi:pimeloyl-ACP methyl ester carboxylesterase